MQLDTLHDDAIQLTERLQALFSQTSGTWKYAPDQYQLQQTNVVANPNPGVLVWCYHSSLPGSHILRIWIPALTTTGSIYSHPSAAEPEWAILILEEMDTHSCHRAWEYDDHTGGAWLDGRTLLQQQSPIKPEYMRWPSSDA